MTIVELVAAMAILVVLVAAVALLEISGRRAMRRGSEEALAERRLALALDRAVASLRGASSASLVNGRLRAQGRGGVVIEIWLDGAATELWLDRGGSVSLLAEGVADANFQVVTPRLVRLSLLSLPEGGQPVRMETTVYLRGVGSGGP